jgi:hypothetical protein
MKNSNPIALVHLQWFGENDGQEPAAPADPAPAAPPASWRDTLPDNLKNSPSLAKFDAVEKLSKSYVELETMLGKNIIQPGKDAKPEDWDKFYSKLGRPKVAEEYVFDPIAGLEENPASMSKLRQAFYAAGLAPSQAKTIFGAIAEDKISSDSTAREVTAQAIAAGEASLRQEWGVNYDNNVALARSYALEVGGKEAVSRLEEFRNAAGGNAASDPLVLKLLARAGQATNGKPLVRGGGIAEKEGPYAYMNRGEKKPT